MARKKKEFLPLYGIDPAKVEDMQSLADELKKLDKHELAYISGAIQMARLIGTLNREPAQTKPA